MWDTRPIRLWFIHLFYSLIFIRFSHFGFIQFICSIYSFHFLFIHSFHSFSTFIHHSLHSFIYYSIHSFIYSFIRSFHSFNPFIPSIHSFVYSYRSMTRSHSIHSLFFSLRLSISLFIPSYLLVQSFHAFVSLSSHSVTYLVTFPLLAALILFLDQFAVTFSLRRTKIGAVKNAHDGSRVISLAFASRLAPNHNALFGWFGLSWVKGI